MLFENERESHFHFEKPQNHQNKWNRKTVEEECTYTTKRTVTRKTALFVAVSKRNVEMTKLLLIHGADAPPKALDILEKPIECDGDENVRTAADEAEAKRQISAILKSKVRWFPELVEFYPQRMGEALSVVVDTLSDEHFPEEIIHFVIEYFCQIETVKDDCEHFYEVETVGDEEEEEDTDDESYESY